jgi:hypothetical protein
MAIKLAHDDREFPLNFQFALFADRHVTLLQVTPTAICYCGSLTYVIVLWDNDL